MVAHSALETMDACGEGCTTRKLSFTFGSRSLVGVEHAPWRSNGDSLAEVGDAVKPRETSLPLFAVGLCQICHEDAPQAVDDSRASFSGTSGAGVTLPNTKKAESSSQTQSKVDVVATPAGTSSGCLTSQVARYTRPDIWNLVN